MAIFIDKTTQQTALARYAEKTHLILSWLLRFRFSTSTMLTTVTSTKPTNTRILYLLRKTGLLSNFQHSVDGRQFVIWHLTSNGINQALALDQSIEWVNRKNYYPKHRSTAHLNHDLMVQEKILSWKSDINLYTITPENMIKNFHKRKPDATFESDGLTWAIEIEKTRKSTARIFHNYLHHLNAIYKHKHYDRLLYVFSTNDVHRTYRKHWDTRHWPLLEYDETRQRYVNSGDTWDRGPPDQFSDRILFETFDTKFEVRDLRPR